MADKVPVRIELPRVVHRLLKSRAASEGRTLRSLLLEMAEREAAGPPPAVRTSPKTTEATPALTG